MSSPASAPPRILTIAGSDSSGGAGVQADIKTITMLGGYAMSAITAVTAQNTLGVQAVETHSADFVEAQITACLSDIGADAIKIGMLGSAEIAHRVADLLENFAGPMVFDPVMVATSGSALADASTIQSFSRLIRMAKLSTPNIAELRALGGHEAMQGLSPAYLAKGGDSESDVAIDTLVTAGANNTVWQAPKITTRHTHGTGCTLSSAIATFLAFGLTLPDSIARAREFVRLALFDAPGFGAKAGPLGHQAVRMDLTGQPRLNQITLAAGNYEDSVLFYRALGLQQIVDSPSNGYARFESPGGTTLSISTGHGETGGAAVYFECLDVVGWTNNLRAAGVECPPPKDQSWNWRESWITDPNGNRICFFQAGEHRRYPPWRIPAENLP